MNLCLTDLDPGDEELDTLIKATIAGGGVIPHIHKSLINKAVKKEGMSESRDREVGPLSTVAALPATAQSAASTDSNPLPPIGPTNVQSLSEETAAMQR